MEILKNLAHNELNDLRDVFEKNKQKSLSRREFRRALRAASTGKDLPFRITKAYMNHLFSSVDVAGDERVTWNDFSMYVVEQARTSAEITIPYKDQIVVAKKTKLDVMTSGKGPEESESSPSDDDEDLQSRRQLDMTTAKLQITEGRGKECLEEFAGVRNYHVDGLEVNPLGVKLVDMRLLPRTTRLVKVTENLKGQRALTLHEDEEKFPVVGSLPRRIEPFSCWEHIPNTGGIKHSNSIVSAYSNGIVQIYELPEASELKRSSEFLTCLKTMHTPDTQTSMQWSSLYGRLLMGSSNGIVSVWDVDSDHLASQERLHMLSVTNCRMRSNFLYTASVDRFDSVKAVDLEKSVVVYSFSDHIVGGALTLSVDQEYIISSGCEIKIVLRSVQAPNANFTNLYDCVAPHQGRISAVHRLPSTPLLVSGDSRGNLKIWDLRMNSCVQTFPASSFGYVKKSAASHKKPQDAMLLPPIAGGGGGGGVAKEKEKDRDDASQVTAICPLPKLGLITIGTGSHRYTLTALDAAFPDRVDDEIPCRFILTPNASQLLTIHGSYFKLWNITTGHTIYTSKMSAVHGDITAVTLVEPLKRQMLCGTLEGDLKGFTVSLGKRVFNFFPALRDSENLRENRPILSLDTIPSFRDQPMPYAIITYDDGVVMLPIMPHVRADHLVRLHVVSGLLEEHQHTIKETRYREKQLYVALSNNTVHLVDLHFNTVTATYRLPTTDLDNIFIGVTTEGSYRNMEASFSSKRRLHSAAVQSFFFAADGSGNIMCGKGVHFNNVEDVAGNHLKVRRLIIGLWNTGQPDSWKPAQRREHRNSGRRSRSMGIEDDECNNSESFLPKIPPDASPAVTHMFFFGLFLCLVTGDERGNVKLWDMGGVLMRNTPTMSEESVISRRVSMQPSARRQSLVATTSAHHMVPSTTMNSSKPLSNSLDTMANGGAGGGLEPSFTGYGPVMVARWHAHAHGFTSLAGLDHPHLMLPVILTGGPDYHLLMWSCDGYPLGSFATGRQIDDTSGGRRFGLLPYCFQQAPSELTFRWEKFLEYFRGNPGRKPAVEMEEMLSSARPLSSRGDQNTYEPMPLRHGERGLSMSVMDTVLSAAVVHHHHHSASAGGENPLYVTEPHLGNVTAPSGKTVMLRTAAPRRRSSSDGGGKEGSGGESPMASSLSKKGSSSDDPPATRQRTTSSSGDSDTEKGDSPSGSNRASPSMFTRENSEAFFGNRLKSEDWTTGGGQVPPFWDKTTSRTFSPSFSRPSSAESGLGGNDLGDVAATSTAGIIQSKFQFSQNPHRRKHFRLARTGACLKSHPRGPHHHLPALPLPDSSTTTTPPPSSAPSSTMTPPHRHSDVPAMVPTPAPSHIPTDLGNGVLEVRVRQQFILGEPIGRSSAAVGKGVTLLSPRHPHADHHHHPREKTRPVEVSARMAREVTDFSVNVHGKVQAPSQRRRVMRGPVKDESKQATLAKLLPHS